MLFWIAIFGGSTLMMGQHTRSESLFYYFRLEDQVPENHLLRLVDKYIDFGFVRERVKDSYSETGRPSIDPELLLRILLIGYLYGISSERKLVEELRMHLATVRCLTGRLRSSPAGYKRDSAAPVRLLFRCPDLPVHSCARCPFIGKIQNARRSGDVFDSTLTVVHLLEHSLEPLYSRVADLNRCTH
jgi:hypothetical protein